MSIGFSEHGLKMHMEDMIMEKEEEKEAFLVLSSNELASKKPQEYKKLLLLSCYNFRLPILFGYLFSFTVQFDTLFQNLQFLTEFETINKVSWEQQAFVCRRDLV